MERVLEQEPFVMTATVMTDRATDGTIRRPDIEKAVDISGQHDGTDAEESTDESEADDSTADDSETKSAWSRASVIVFIIGNVMFALYCIVVIPLIQGRPQAIVISLATYISMLGFMQLFEGLVTGSGTNYGKFGGDGGSDAAKGCYQRLMDSMAKPTVPISISWWTMEQPSFIVPLVFLCLFILNGNRLTCGSIYLGMFMLHYAQRSFVYPILTRGKPYPSLYWFLALVFTSCNGTLQSLDLLYSGRYSNLEDVLSLWSIIGVSIFAFGMYTNIRCDYILRNLRKPGETGYKIPEGFMFEYISGANLWGEVVEWTGFAIATRGIGAAVFAVFCLVGIGSRCVATHTWYLKKFGEEYPKQRKHLIPFVW